jgi:D-aspartate ligase
MQSHSGPGEKPYAIVVGLDSTQGLQTARILDAHQVPVIAIAKDPRHYCCRTRVCEKIFFANTGNNEFIKVLEDLGPRIKQRAVLIPCNDMSVLLVSRHRHILERWYYVGLPAPDVVEMMLDKVRFYTFAQEEGLPIPNTYLIHDRSDVEQALNTLNFPCVLKPPISATPEWERNSKLKAFKIFNTTELFALYDRCKELAEVLILQEWVGGDDSSLYICNSYFNADSQPVATFASRKIRQWPPQTGECSLGVECQSDVILSETIRLFRKVNFRGLGYLEMKRDERSGDYFIMEPNIGRPTGQASIAEAGGVELTYAMYCDNIGLPLPEGLEQRDTGVKWIFLRRDFQSALHYWRQGKLTLKDWWLSWRGRKRYALFSWRDPAPFWGDLCRSICLFMSPVERKKRDYSNPLS